jgi:hypothetical protein
MPKSQYLDNVMLNAVLNDVSYESPPAVYVAIYTTSPTPTSAGVEVSGGSYARQAVTWTSASEGVVSNVADILFPTASATWGTIVAWGIVDNVSGGNLLYYGALGAPRTVLASTQVSFPAGQLQITEA